MKKKFLPTHSLILIGIIGLFTTTLWRNAWVCDDAYITFRVINNFWNSFGFVWNTAERVQVYTHPLWMMLLLIWHPIFGGLYSTAIFLSFCCTLFTLGLFVKFNNHNYLAILLGILLLMFSKAFIDFSTSGLENPLTHFLLMLFLWLLFKEPVKTRNPAALGLIFSALFLTRMDAIVTVVPVILFYLVKAFSLLKVSRFLCGLIPILVWELFSLVYYGFLLPNTAYAKLQTGIHWSERLSQGLAYVSNSLINDPVTFPVILLAIVIPIVCYFNKNNSSLWVHQSDFFFLSIGLLLYVGYVISIGGDFMSGRFWTPAYLVSVVVLTHFFAKIPDPQGIYWLMGLIALIGLSNPLSPVRSTVDYFRQNQQLFDANQISDERAMVFATLGLPNRFWLNATPEHPRVGEALRIRAKEVPVTMHGAVGLFGFYVGPHVHVLDYYALTDPLLARLPGVKNLIWRPGHIRRTLPKGYMDSLPDQTNQIEDPKLAQYYDHIRTITRGPLFTWKRWQAIAQYHLGYFDHLIEEQAYRYPGMIERQLSELQKPLTAGDAWDHPNTQRIYAGGVRVYLPEKTQASRIKLFLDSDDTYGIIYLNNEQEIAQQVLNTIWEEETGMQPRIVDVPSTARRKGLTAIHIMPLRGNREYSVGGIEVLE